jgi:large subunit ribosomal protein L18
MANKQVDLQRKRERKASGVRAGVRGTAAKPRLSVFRSSKFVYCQAIDDVAGSTLAAASDKEKELSAACADLPKSESAKRVGQEIAKRLLAKGIERVVFDRGWYKYHGRVKALADAARESGLKF